MNFQKSLDEGHRGERRFTTLLERAGLVGAPAPNRDHDVAFSLPDLDSPVIFAEVKYDRMQAKTNNIALEYHNSRQDKPSGITASQSHLWIYVLDRPRSVWAARTDVLRQFFDNEPFLRDIVHAGDGNASLRLYSTAHFLSVFHRLDEYAPGDLPGILRGIINGC